MRSNHNGKSLPRLEEDSVDCRGTVSIQTHGCKLNQADSDALARSFVQAGFSVVSPSEPADVYVVNSCTVTHVADSKARQALRIAHRQNPSGPGGSHRLLCAAGAQRGRRGGRGGAGGWQCEEGAPGRDGAGCAWRGASTPRRWPRLSCPDSWPRPWPHSRHGEDTRRM